MLGGYTSEKKSNVFTISMASLILFYGRNGSIIPSSSNESIVCSRSISILIFTSTSISTSASSIYLLLSRFLSYFFAALFNGANATS